MKFSFILLALILLSGCTTWHDRLEDWPEDSAIRTAPQQPITLHRNSEGKWSPNTKAEKLRQQGINDNSTDSGRPY